MTPGRWRRTAGVGSAVAGHAAVRILACLAAGLTLGLLFPHNPVVLGLAQSGTWFPKTIVTFATAIIFSGAGPEGKGKTSMSPGGTTLVNTLSAMAYLPERSRFLVRPQRLTRCSPLPIGRGLSPFTTDLA